MENSKIQKYINFRANALERLLGTRQLNGKGDYYDYSIAVSMFRRFAKPIAQGMTAKGDTSYFKI